MLCLQAKCEFLPYFIHAVRCTFHPDGWPYRAVRRLRGSTVIIRRYPGQSTIAAGAQRTGNSVHHKALIVSAPHLSC